MLGHFAWWEVWYVISASTLIRHSFCISVRYQYCCMEYINYKLCMPQFSNLYEKYSTIQTLLNYKDKQGTVFNYKDNNKRKLRQCACTYKYNNIFCVKLRFFLIRVLHPSKALAQGRVHIFSLSHETFIICNWKICHVNWMVL